MKKTILTTFLVSIVTASSLYASGCKSQEKEEYKSERYESKVCDKKKEKCKESKCNKNRGATYGIDDLELSFAQMKKIKELRGVLFDANILIKSKLRDIDMSDYVKESGFDKKEFKNEYMKNFDKMVQNKADFMESVYAILTKEQKEKLVNNK